MLATGALLLAALAFFPGATHAAACFITPANTGSEPTPYDCPATVTGQHDECFFASLSQDGSIGTFRPDTCPEGFSRLPEPSRVAQDCQGPDIRAGAPEGDPNHCGILDYIVIFINVLSAMAAIAVVAAIIYGGIQYSSAGSDPQKVSAAKARIRNAIIALIFFIFGYAILNWLVPGGVLS